MRNINILRNFSLRLVLALVFLFGIPALITQADVQDEIEERNKQIEEIQKQIEGYQNQLDQSRTQSLTLENEIARLNAQINQVQLEIRSLNLSINKTSGEINETETKINDAELQMSKHKNALRQYIKIAYENDQNSLTEILFKNENLSDFFNELNNIQNTQDSIKVTIRDIRQLRNNLEQHQENLKDKQAELEQLKFLQEIEKRSLDSSKTSQNKLLKETKGQENRFQELVKKSQKNIEAIKNQIFYLQQNGISAEDAVKYAQLAAIGAGIRPAFLLSLLEVESGLGRNVGKGNWKDDMYECYIRLGTVYYPSKKTYYIQRAETEKAAFFEIVGKLGLDPNSVKVSKEPYYGCGGAMGPAQFIPSTWLSYEDEIGRLTGHNPPSPWSVEDAFTASAVKLARAGATAQTRTAEIKAAKIYLSGKSTCSSSACNSYANSIMRKADEIEKNL